MLFIRTDDLKPGMRLAKPIYNKLGVMLYDRDTRLTRQGIESIRNFELIGIYILEPAEPVPPLSDEDIAFEQFQTISSRLHGYDSQRQTAGQASNAGLFDSVPVWPS